MAKPDFDSATDPVSGRKHRISDKKSSQKLAKQLGAIHAGRRAALAGGRYVQSMRFTSVTNAGSSRLAGRVGTRAATDMVKSETDAGIARGAHAGYGKQPRRPAGSPTGGQFAPKG